MRVPRAAPYLNSSAAKVSQKGPPGVIAYQLNPWLEGDKRFGRLNPWASAACIPGLSATLALFPQQVCRGGLHVLGVAWCSTRISRHGPELRCPSPLRCQKGFPKSVVEDGCTLTNIRKPVFLTAGYEQSLVWAHQLLKFRRNGSIKWHLLWA